MAEIRRRKPDDDSGKQVDDENLIALKPDRGGDGSNVSDDEHQLHHKKSTNTLTTADSSDHVNKFKRTCFIVIFIFVDIACHDHAHSNFNIDIFSRFVGLLQKLENFLETMKLHIKLLAANNKSQTK